MSGANSFFACTCTRRSWVAGTGISSAMSGASSSSCSSIKKVVTSLEQEFVGDLQRQLLVPLPHLLAGVWQHR